MAKNPTANARRWVHPWPRKIPHSAGLLSLCTEPACPGSHAPQQEKLLKWKPAHHNYRKPVFHSQTKPMQCSPPQPKTINAFMTLIYSKLPWVWSKTLETRRREAWYSHGITKSDFIGDSWASKPSRLWEYCKWEKDIFNEYIQRIICVYRIYEELQANQ